MWAVCVFTVLSERCPAAPTPEHVAADLGPGFLVRAPVHRPGRWGRSGSQRHQGLVNDYRVDQVR